VQSVSNLFNDKPFPFVLIQKKEKIKSCFSKV